MIAGEHKGGHLEFGERVARQRVVGLVPGVDDVAGYDDGVGPGRQRVQRRDRLRGERVGVDLAVEQPARRKNVEIGYLGDEDHGDSEACWREDGRRCYAIRAALKR